MAVILLPLHMPAMAWVPQRMTYAPMPKRVTPADGTPPLPEIDYWEFTDAVNRALRVQFRVPSGYESTVDPTFSFQWFTPQTNYANTPTVKIYQAGCQESDHQNLNALGVGTLGATPIIRPYETANTVLDGSATLEGTLWHAGALATIVFYRNGTSGDDLDAVLNFLGGDLLIGVTKEMG